MTVCTTGALKRTDSYNDAGVAICAPTKLHGPEWQSADAYQTQGPPFAWHDR